jgi:enhancing lycopene biosynthesis protein 2
VNHDVAKLCVDVHAAGKPIGFACIAPVIAARLFGGTVTIGNDAATAAAIEHMGAKHSEAGPTDICIDEKNRIVTTPCYMYESSPWQVFQGADKMVDAVLKMVKK